MIGTGGYNLVVDYDVPQRSEDDKTFQLEGGTERRGMDRMRMTFNFQLAEPEGASGTSPDPGLDGPA